MICVTHTQPLILAATGRHDRLGKRASRIFQDVDEGKERLVVPVAVLEEILFLCEKKAVRLRIPFPRWVEEMERSPNFQLQPHTPDILLQAQGLAAVQHPRDRIIVATARHLGYPLITADETLRELGLVETVWE